MRIRALIVAVALLLAPFGSAATEPGGSKSGGSEPGEGTIEAEYARAGEAYRSGNHTRAARLFRRLVKRAPDDPAVHFYLADSLSREGWHQEARKHLALFLKTLVDQRETALAEYRPELTGSVDLMERLERAENAAPQPVEDDIAPVFGGIAIGAGVAALGLAAAVVVSYTAAETAEKEWEGQQDIPSETCSDCRRKVLAAWSSTNALRKQTNGFVLAASVTGGLALASAMLWLGLRSDDSTVEITPDAGLGDASFGGISIGGRF